MKKIFRKENIFILIVFVFALSTIIIKPLGDLDEIWNYNVARNIAKGLIPYKEISTITTPFLPIINSIFLKFIADELIVMRILAAVLITAIIYMIYKIFKEITKENTVSMIIAMLMAILLQKNYCIDYNYMVLFLTLILTYLELRNSNKNNDEKENSEQQKVLTKKTILFELTQGIIAGLAICTKQSLGFFIAIVTVICPLLQSDLSKNSQKQKIQKMGLRIAGIAIPGFILIGYLLITVAWDDFISYAIKGISTFNNSIPYKKLYMQNGIIGILARILPYVIAIEIVLVIMLILKSFKKKEKQGYLEKLIICSIYSLPMLIVIYPIADEIHFLIGSIMTWIEFSAIIFVIVKEIIKKILITEENKRKKNLDKDKIKRKRNFIYKTIILLICIGLLDFLVVKNYKNIKSYINQNKNYEIKHYKGIEVPDVLKERTKVIEEFTNKMEKENKEVYILDAEAAVYNIPLDKYTKNYDMFLKGNIGKDGEEGIIKQIQKDSENKVYLIKQEKYLLNWQTPTKVVEYVRNNMKKLEDVDIFEAYEQ